jgi:hypothetical protein
MNNLKLVTISGADDNVDIKALENLSKKYPYVEWGILVSSLKSNPIKSRYPSEIWLRKFVHAKVKKSIHLCSEAARVFAGNEKSKEDYYFLQSLLPLIAKFDRVQLNYANQLNDIEADIVSSNIEDCYMQNFILQMNGDSDEVFKKIKSELTPDFNVNIHPFLDVSQGKGIEGHWEFDFKYKGFKGFAGGININNIDSVIKKITENNPTNPFWIDMETGVRTNNQFDLALAEEILIKVKPYLVDSNSTSSIGKFYLIKDLLPFLEERELNAMTGMINEYNKVDEKTIPKFTSLDELIDIIKKSNAFEYMPVSEYQAFLKK